MVLRRITTNGIAEYTRRAADNAHTAHAYPVAKECQSQQDGKV